MKQIWKYIKAQLSISAHNKTRTYMEVLLDDGWHHADELGADGYELVSVVIIEQDEPVGIFKKRVFANEEEAFDL